MALVPAEELQPAPAPAPAAAPHKGGNYAAKLIDPLSGALFVDAVIVTCCGTSFSKKPLQAYLAERHECPHCKTTVRDASARAPTLPAASARRHRRAASQIPRSRRAQESKIKMLPNRSLRDAVDAALKAAEDAAPAAEAASSASQASNIVQQTVQHGRAAQQVEARPPADAAGDPRLAAAAAPGASDVTPSSGPATTTTAEELQLGQLQLVLQQLINRETQAELQMVQQQGTLKQQQMMHVQQLQQEAQMLRQRMVMQLQQMPPQMAAMQAPQVERQLQQQARRPVHASSRRPERSPCAPSHSLRAPTRLIRPLPAHEGHATLRRLRLRNLLAPSALGRRCCRRRHS